MADANRRPTLSNSTAEAQGLPEAERIPGSMLLREVEADDFPDTGPEVHPVSTEPQANSVSLTPVAS